MTTHVYCLITLHYQTEITELTERCMELQEQAANSKRLKDEVDELKYRLTNTGQ